MGVVAASTVVMRAFVVVPEVVVIAVLAFLALFPIAMGGFVENVVVPRLLPPAATIWTPLPAWSSPLSFSCTRILTLTFTSLPTENTTKSAKKATKSSPSP